MNSNPSPTPGQSPADLAPGSGRNAGAARSAEAAAQLQSQARRARAVADLTRTAVSPGNLAEVLHLATRSAAEATDSRGAALWLIGAGGARRLEVTYGPQAERERWARALEGVAAAVMTRSRPRISEQPADEFLLAPAAAATLRAFAVLPLIAYGRTLGAIAVYDDARTPMGGDVRFEAADREFLLALANLTALAVDHAGKFHELRDAEQQVTELKARLVRQERLAALGEWASGIREECRHPLASIQTFGRRVLETLEAGDPRRQYVEILTNEAGRLERSLVVAAEEAAAWMPPALRLQSLNDVTQDALQAFGERLVRRRIRLVKKLSPELPPLLLDGERIRHVLARILEHAIDLVAIGGRIRVETRRAPQHAVVEVAHDGLRSSGDALEQLLTSFNGGVPGAVSGGLAIAQRIVREHGGEIRVRSEGEASTVVSFTLPILANQDRRRSGTDRRHSLGDRRARWPAAK